MIGVGIAPGSTGASPLSSPRWRISWAMSTLPKQSGSVRSSRPLRIGRWRPRWPLLGNGVARVLLGPVALVRAGHDLPEIPVGIREVAEVASPRGALRGLDDGATGALGLGEHGVHAVVGSDDVREREPAEAAALRGDAGVAGEESPLVDAERRRPRGGGEGNEVGLVDLDGPPQPLAVELPRPMHVLDADLDPADVRVHTVILLEKVQAA